MVCGRDVVPSGMGFLRDAEELYSRASGRKELRSRGERNSGGGSWLRLLLRPDVMGRQLRENPSAARKNLSRFRKKSVALRRNLLSSRCKSGGNKKKGGKISKDLKDSRPSDLGDREWTSRGAHDRA